MFFECLLAGFNQFRVISQSQIVIGTKVQYLLAAANFNRRLLLGSDYPLIFIKTLFFKVFELILDLAIERLLAHVCMLDSCSEKVVSARAHAAVPTNIATLLLKTDW